LDSAILAPLGEDVHQVILILMDGLAFHRLQRWMEDGSSPVWKLLHEHGVLAPITSVTPSTTTSALTTLWTGRSPKEHGIVGYELWLKEYGIVTNMVLQSPMSYQHNGSSNDGSLSRAGFDPQEFLSLTTLGSHLRAHGVQGYAFQHYSILNSGLSRMLMNDVTLRGFGSPRNYG